MPKTSTDLHRRVLHLYFYFKYGSFGHLDLFQKEDYKLIITVPFEEVASILRTTILKQTNKLYELSLASDNGIHSFSGHTEVTTVK